MRTDSLGLYLTPWHGFISNLALLMSGMDPITATYVAGADMGQDFIPGSQDPGNSNRHAMAIPGQSRGDAIQETDNYINNATSFGTLTALGAALHDNEDEYAEGHNYQEWLGGFPSLDHLLGDAFPTFDQVINAVATDMLIIDRWKENRYKKRKVQCQ